MNLPNKLTVARILFVIPFAIFASLAIYFIKTPNNFVIFNSLALTTFIVAMLTDFLDGYLARKYHLVTDFGKLWDPIADKLITVCFIFYLTQLDKIYWFVAAFFILRDIIVDGARVVMAQNKIEVAANKWGKLKTILITAFLIVTSIIVSLEAQYNIASITWANYLSQSIYTILLVSSVFLSLISVLIYLRAILPYIKNK
ncbi:CDP-diacylglycerol--glycerol-3-phosphate 3-phosphatidyltransferase [Mycoplasma corogypsi]|uniref:CDP-diacylglycerol--glycerol-3-phosphate 3-phosphatidyltransferase n=1 Tax=Mycoplasma corogypsi TaxID=2106 RepID=UPI0038739EB7